MAQKSGPNNLGEEKQAVGVSIPQLSCWLRTLPIPLSEGSAWKRNAASWSELVSTGICVNFFLEVVEVMLTCWWPLHVSRHYLPGEVG